MEIEAVDHSEHASFGILYDYTKCFDYDLERNLPWPVPRLQHGYGWYGTNSLLPSSVIPYWNFFHHRGNKSERLGMGRYSCQTVVLFPGGHRHSAVTLRVISLCSDVCARAPQASCLQPHGTYVPGKLLKKDMIGVR